MNSRDKMRAWISKAISGEDLLTAEGGGNNYLKSYGKKKKKIRVKKKSFGPMIEDGNQGD